MSRKDTILIAVIINAGLLAILFATAIIYDTDKLIDHLESDTSLVEAPPFKPDGNLNYIASASSTFDEMDQELKNYVEPISTVLEEENFDFPESPVAEPAKVIVRHERNVEQPDYVEIVVKKGDSLDKIAKANRTTVEFIKKANRLNTERLAIGQKLRIPLKNELNPLAGSLAPINKPQQVVTPIRSEDKKIEPSSAVYHVVKSGDSPWKIAKEYGVNYEQILKLNHLDEDKARNLKIGDHIRVK